MTAPVSSRAPQARARRARPAPRAVATAALALVASFFATVVSTGAPAGASVAAPAAPGAPVEPTPSCPAAAGNARFVRFVYLEILNRCPDGGGAAHWTAALDAGLGRWAFAEAIDTSRENLVVNNVDPLYQDLLGRAPTAAERDAWVAYLRREHANAVPTAALLASPESYDARTSGTAAERDRQWLTIAYNRILDRAPDPSGLDWWAARLAASGSSVQARAQARFRVAMTFEHSDSNARSWVRAAMAEALGRPADPSGQAYWLAWLTGPGHWRTFQLWTHQLASDEAYRRSQTQPG